MGNRTAGRHQPGHIEWLREQAEETAAHARLQVFLAACRRDGWAQVESPVAYDQLWPRLFGEGGAFEAWIQHGTPIPRYSLIDAGVKASD